MDNLNDKQSNEAQNQPSCLGADTCRYYNAGGIGMGLIVCVHIDNIKHQDGEHTFLTGRQPEYQWIRTVDLYDTYEEAKNAPVARFYNGRNSPMLAEVGDLEHETLKPPQSTIEAEITEQIAIEFAEWILESDHIIWSTPKKELFQEFLKTKQ